MLLTISAAKNDQWRVEDHLKRVGNQSWRNHNSECVNYTHWHFNVQKVMAASTSGFNPHWELCWRFGSRGTPCNHRLSADEKWFLFNLMCARSIDYSTNSSMNDSFGFILISPREHFALSFIYLDVNFGGSIFDLSITVCFQLCFQVA